MPICLRIVYGCFCAPEAELISGDRDHLRLQCLKYLLSGPLQKIICQPLLESKYWGPEKHRYFLAFIPTVIT